MGKFSQQPTTSVDSFLEEAGKPTIVERDSVSESPAASVPPSERPTRPAPWENLSDETLKPFTLRLTERQHAILTLISKKLGEDDGGGSIHNVVLSTLFPTLERRARDLLKKR